MVVSTPLFPLSPFGPVTVQASPKFRGWLRGVLDEGIDPREALLIQDMLEQCLALDPMRRPTFQALMAHFLWYDADDRIIMCKQLVMEMASLCKDKHPSRYEVGNLGGLSVPRVSAARWPFFVLALHTVVGAVGGRQTCSWWGHLCQPWLGLQ